MSSIITRCGVVIIIGRSNVGKSTLFNRLVGQKISITSCKSYTTQDQVVGINTEGLNQVIYVDTPGLRNDENHKILRLINLISNDYIGYLTLVIFVVEGIKWMPGDLLILNELNNINNPVILVINKIDNIFIKNKLLPHISFLAKKRIFHDIVSVCAKHDIYINILEKIVYEILPLGNHIFPKDYMTNCSKRFLASEIIREKLMRFLSEELPYSIDVQISSFEYNEYYGYNIYALILTERDSQKKIIIGNSGKKIKA